MFRKQCVRRLRLLESNDIHHEDAMEWPDTCGYLLKSDGFPISEEATRHACEIFHAVVDEARSHYFTCNSNRARFKELQSLFGNISSAISRCVRT